MSSWILFQQSCDVAGAGKLTSRAPRGSVRGKRQSGSHRITGLGGKPPFAAGKPTDILSMLKEDKILPASEYRVVLAMVKASA